MKELFTKRTNLISLVGAVAVIGRQQGWFDLDDKTAEAIVDVILFGALIFLREGTAKVERVARRAHEEAEAAHLAVKSVARRL